MTIPPLIFGPVPPETNPPIRPEYFQPSRFFISNIALGPTTTITTTTSMNYVLGQQVRLNIPFGFGTRELNQQTGFVISIPSPTQVELDIFSVGLTTFVNNPNYTTKPQIVAIGDRNSGLISSTGRVNSSTTIPGAFENISPN